MLNVATYATKIYFVIYLIVCLLYLKRINITATCEQVSKAKTTHSLPEQINVDNNQSKFGFYFCLVQSHFRCRRSDVDII